MSFIAKFNGNMNLLGNTIRKYRIQNNISYEMLSAKLELIGISIHKQSLYDIEKNKRTLKDYELFGIAYILNLDLNQILNEIKQQFI